MFVLAIDTGTHTGWAAGNVDSGPTFGTHTLPKTGENIGRFMAAYDDWLCAMIEEYEPQIVVYEKPVMSFGKTNLWTRVKLDALAAHTEYRCFLEETKCHWLDNQTVKKHFVGMGNFGKKTKPYPMFGACEQRGWSPQTTDEADALGIWDLAIHKVDPKGAVKFDPLFMR